jgi:ribonuclease HI
VATWDRLELNTAPSSIVIYTDGACTGNPGPGGWGSIVALPDGSVREMGGSAPQTTNNRMEMSAAIHALGALDLEQGHDIIIYTDSTYLIQGITKWVWGWRNRGWKSAEGKDVANREMWEELVRQVSRVKPAKIDWKYVRGHTGNEGNERCDTIAVAFSHGKREQLYVGPIDAYFVDLSEQPEEAALPERKSNGSGPGGTKSAGTDKAAPGHVTYLVSDNGVVTRYHRWADCEKAVKGRNVKFKKAKSEQEERAILVSWGLDPSTHIE